MKKRYTFSPKTWLRAGLFTAFAFSFTLSLQAQTAPAKLWDKTFGGSSDEFLPHLQQTSDGGFILGGSSASGISGDKTQACKGNNDYWVLKLDAIGNRSWDKTFGGSDEDELHSLQQTSDGGFILGGASISDIGGDKTQACKGSWDYWIVKLDANGNKLWDKTFGGNNEDWFYAIQQTSDGGYILGGSSQSTISGDKTQGSKGYADYWIVKLDANGNKLWDKTIGGSDGDFLSSVKQTLDGGYILGGPSDSGISSDKSQACQGGDDYWVVKLDASGNKVWDKTFGGNGEDGLLSLQQTLDGGYILGGTSESGVSGDKSQILKGGSDYWVVKLDGSGNKTWDKTFGGSNKEWLASLQQTSDGGYLLGGTSGSGISGDKTQISNGGPDYWLVNLDPNGNKIWDKTIGGSSWDHLSTLEKTLDGSYFLGGWTDSPLSIDKTQPSNGGHDYWVVKLGASPTGLKEPEASFNLSLFPNPNQGKFHIKLSNLTASKAAITVSDLLGRVVLQKVLHTTNNQISEELTLPNTKGIYLLQLKAGEQIITRKIVVE